MVLSLRSFFYFAWFCWLHCVASFEYFICLKCSWPICVPYLIVQYPGQSWQSESVKIKYIQAKYNLSIRLVWTSFCIPGPPLAHHTAIRIRVTLVAQLFNIKYIENQRDLNVQPNLSHSLYLHIFWNWFTQCHSSSFKWDEKDIVDCCLCISLYNSTFS